jgi:hypothetical protein
MALGKPVISTAYSSTLEFANESNSFLVPARLTEVGDHAPPYPPRSCWAEPDLAAAARQMARVYADPGAAAAVGARARADIQALHSPRARGPLLRRLLEEHRLEMPAPAQTAAEVTGPPVALEMDAFELDAIAAESLLGSPRPDLPSPMQRLMTPLRRLVLRCIRVYWVQQLAIHRALLTAMRTLRRESRVESASQAAMIAQQREAQEQTGAETARMREDLTELAADIRALRERMAALTTPAAPGPRQAVLSDDELTLRRETDR